MARSGGSIPVDALTRFTSAEGRLYPLALSDPAGYEAALTSVGVVADELRRTCADVGAVLERRDALIEQLPRLIDDAGLTVSGLPADAVVDAASALRCRELGATVGPETFGA